MPTAHHAAPRIEILRPRRAIVPPNLASHNPHRVLQHNLEHRVQFTARRAELTFRTSLVAVCCSSDLVKIVGALAQLIEQPRVLDGDDGLRGEVLNKLDLLVGEGADLLAVDDAPAAVAVPQHRHCKQCAYSAELDTLDGERIDDRYRPAQPSSR